MVAIAASAAMARPGLRWVVSEAARCARCLVAERLAPSRAPAAHYWANTWTSGPARIKIAAMGMFVADPRLTSFNRSMR